MISKFKKIFFRSLSLENYLRLLQRSYFILYKAGILRFSSTYIYHYFVKKLINKGDVVIDIGANLGYYSMLFADWTGPSGKVYAVEPVPVYNKIFNEIANKHNNIVLYPYALGAEEKTIEMVSSPNKGYLSTGFLHVYDSQRDGKIEEEEFRFESLMKMPSKLFSSLNKIDYIKSDIEGFEYIVLASMKEIIQKHTPIIQVEIIGENKERLNNLFSDMGYISYTLVNKRLIPETDYSDKTGGEYIFIHKNNKMSGKN